MIHRRLGRRGAGPGARTRSSGIHRVKMQSPTPLPSIPSGHPPPTDGNGDSVRSVVQAPFLRHPALFLRGSIHLRRVGASKRPLKQVAVDAAPCNASCSKLQLQRFPATARRPAATADQPWHGGESRPRPKSAGKISIPEPLLSTCQSLKFFLNLNGFRDAQKMVRMAGGVQLSLQSFVV